jgi:hypothetical protein
MSVGVSAPGPLSGSEARACLDGIGPGDAGIGELADQIEAGSPGKALYGRALPFFAVLVGAGIGRRPNSSRACP